MSDYDDARVEGAKTLGDAYRHVRRDPDAFVAGAQYALDSMLKELETVSGSPVRDYHDHLATRILERAKAGEPQ